MPEKMPGWYGLQTHDNGQLISVQVDLSEFELSGPLEQVEPIRGDGERYGYIAQYDHRVDRKRYYRGPDGSSLPLNWDQLYRRVPFGSVPVHEFESSGYIGTEYRPAPDPAEPDPVTPFKRWWWEVSPLVHHELRAYSVGYNNKGYWMGAYTGDGDIRVYRADEWGNGGYEAWRKVKGCESVSFFMPDPSGEGMNIGTEDDDGPELYWCPDSDFSRIELSAHYGSGMMYALGGAGCLDTGNMVCISSNRDVGGRLAKYNNGWPTFTPECRDTDGHPLIIWDAINWNGEWVAGCSRGVGEYKHPVGFHTGRVAILRNGQWEIKRMQPQGTAGVLRLVRMPTYDPGHLYFTTTYGEVWKTSDLNTFEKVFTVSSDVVEKDVFLFEVEGRPVAVSARGKVYENWQEVLDYSGAFWQPGKNFCSVLPGPRGLLAGPITVRTPDGTPKEEQWKYKGFKIVKLRYEV